MNELSQAWRLLDKAIIFALAAHRDQIDKSGQMYLLHPLRVMDAVRPLGEQAMIAAVLHDVVEDSNVALTVIQEVFGQEVADMVDAVSRREGEIYVDFIKRSGQHPMGRKIKIADIRDNMRADRQTPELIGMKKRYQKALAILGEAE